MKLVGYECRYCKTRTETKQEMSNHLVGCKSRQTKTKTSSSDDDIIEIPQLKMAEVRSEHDGSIQVICKHVSRIN